MLRTPFLVVPAVLAVLLHPVLNRAARAAPLFIPVHAVLQTPSGVPVTGTRTVTFRLYEGQNDPVGVWSETQTLTIENGRITTALGRTIALPSPFTEPNYLGIQVGPDPEMRPRMRIGAAPYALAIPNVYPTAAGMVGINNMSPEYWLDIYSSQPAALRVQGRVFSGPVLELKNALNDPDINKYGQIVFSNNQGTIGQIGCDPYSRMTFSINGTPQMAIEEKAVGIGTNNPEFTLDVRSTGQATARLTSQGSIFGGVFELRNNTASPSMLGAINFMDAAGGYPGQIGYLKPDALAFRVGGYERVRFTNDGRVGIGTASPQYALDVAGVVRANNVSPSDARLKREVAPLSGALDTVMTLRGVTYSWDRAGHRDRNLPEGRQIGFLAQEVERVLPDVVSTDGDGFKSLSYQSLVPVLVEALKEQQTEIDALRSKAARVDALEERLARLEAVLGTASP